MVFVKLCLVYIEEQKRRHMLSYTISYQTPSYQIHHKSSSSPRVESRFTPSSLHRLLLSGFAEDEVLIVGLFAPEADKQKEMIHQEIDNKDLT